MDGGTRRTDARGSSAASCVRRLQIVEQLSPHCGDAAGKSDADLADRANQSLEALLLVDCSFHEFSSQDLAGICPRQLLEERNLPRDFVIRKMLAYVPLQHLGVCCGAVLENDESDEPLAEFV